MAATAIASHNFARLITSQVDGARSVHQEHDAVDPATMDELMETASALDTEIQSIKVQKTLRISPYSTAIASANSQSCLFFALDFQAQVYKKLLANFTEFTQSFENSLELKGKIDELLRQADEMTSQTIDPEVTSVTLAAQKEVFNMFRCLTLTV